MIKGLVVGHKNIGEGLLKALKSISGSFEDIVFISNEGLSTDEIAKKFLMSAISVKRYCLSIYTGVHAGRLQKNRLCLDAILLRV